MTPVQALQRTLAGEHAALYVYGVLGGRVSDSAHPRLAERLTSAYTTHRGRRDELTDRVRAAGEDPVAAEVSYELPGTDRPGLAAQLDAAAITAAALVTEQRCAVTYAEAVGATSGADRRWAVAALTDAAVRELGFGGAPQPWPGVREL